MATATQFIGSPHRYGSGWLVPSRSDPGVQYYVSADASRCTCTGFSYRRVCAHLRMVGEAQRLIGEILDEDG